MLYRYHARMAEASLVGPYLAKLDFIKDVDEGQEAKNFIIRDFDYRTLKKSCKDGKPCCSRDEVCANEVGRQACI